MLRMLLDVADNSMGNYFFNVGLSFAYCRRRTQPGTVFNTMSLLSDVS